MLCRIGTETGASVGALAVRYLTSQPFPTFPIVGARDINQLAPVEEAVAATLPEEAVSRLNALRLTD